ncbi:hypothetical protein CAEBREN_10198 [Caenorhabditis brenneri]|uniref:DUF281 domain-containing protein n=1 Tax=Caenorhabditis brenneri TaxID=135651 RepID=G0PB22_CAEBE|nr:hypothetical protein CAEBREN_10198 [Caenorhabditis brenneri]
MTIEPTTVEATTEELTTTTVTTTTTVDPDLCNKCNFDAIAPRLLQNNVEYAASDEHPVDGCERKQVLCKRSDRQQCTTVQMFATTADTSVSISMLTTATMVFANIDCDNEGNLSYKGTVNGIEQITCNLEGCALYSNG